MARPSVRRVIATGGGAVVDPRNRWALFRGRISVWLDGRPEVLAQRLRRSPNVRPLVSGRDPIGTIRDLAARRERFYAAATIHQIGVTEVHGVVDAVDQRVAELLAEGRATSGTRTRPTTLLRASTPIGRIVLGEGIAAGAVGSELDALRAPRAILVSEPGAWAAAGERLAAGLGDRGHDVAHILLPQGEAAKRLDVIETAARELAAMRVERGDALVAVGGGALGDAAGFLAAIYLRGIRFIQVPTTLVAQIDSAIGGKTGVDLPEGKNLVGAFHQPAAIVVDVDALRTLPERQMRAALGEAVKMAALGDERLFELLEADGAAIARVDPAVFASGVDRRGRRAGGLGQGRGGRGRRARAGCDRRPAHAQPRVIRSAMPSRRQPATAGCSTARRSPTACAPRPGSASSSASPRPSAPVASARCSTGWVSRPSRSPTRSPRSWTIWPPTRSTRPAGCAGCSRPPTAWSSGTTSTRRSSSAPRPALLAAPSGSAR